MDTCSVIENSNDIVEVCVKKIAGGLPSDDGIDQVMMPDHHRSLRFFVAAIASLLVETGFEELGGVNGLACP